MASRKPLTADDLQALDARRLAELLVEAAARDASVQRRLQLELKARKAPRSVAAEVRKRLIHIGRSRSFVDVRKAREVAADLEMQRRAIVEKVAKIDPAEALDLMWRFMDLASSVFGRCDDSNGEIADVFSAACQDLGPLAKSARSDPVALADSVFTAICENGYGQYDGLIGTLAPVLAGNGFDHLKARLVELSRTPVETPPADRRTAIGWGSGGPFYQDQIDASRRKSTTRRALQAIATAEGDVDGYIAQYDEKARRVPTIAAEIALRLLAAKRAEEGLRTLDAAERRVHGRQPDWLGFEWEDARIQVLDALGRTEDAQTMRWSCFERALSARHLRAWLERLPDFDDIEAERRALDHAERHDNLLRALSFLVSWKALDRAARLVAARARELDGNQYEILAPAAKALDENHPLAATLLRRAMIGFTLDKARSSRYRHAARHYMECASLASSIESFAPFETHEAWAAGLSARHGRKYGFWALISS